MLIEYWFLITSEQIEYDILITKIDQYLNDEVSFLPELLFYWKWTEVGPREISREIYVDCDVRCFFVVSRIKAVY